ncbi:MAG: NHL repeat-containing protein [Nostocoides sp.]
MARYSAVSLGLVRPDALAIAPDGDLYVTDNSQRVSVISASGQVLRRWGKAGTGPGQFRFVAADRSDPTSVAGKLAVGHDGLVYVSDSGNARVQTFTGQGQFLRQFGGYGNRGGQFLSPFDLVVDAEGRIYVADDQRQTLSKITAAGGLIWQIGGGGTSDPDLVGHLHLSTVDVHGRLVVANDGTGRILYLDGNGHKVDAFGGTGTLLKDGPCDVTTDDLGYTYVSPCGPGATYVFDRQHLQVASWPASEGVLATAPRFGPDGKGFALGVDGSIVVVRATLGRS